MEQKANHMNLKGMPMTILRDSLFIYLIDKTNYSIPCVRELETDESYSGKNHRIDYLLLRQNNDFPILHRNFWNFSNCIIHTIIIRCDFQYYKGKGHYCIMSQVTDCITYC